MVFGGVVYFTTYEPDHDLEPPLDADGDVDICAGDLEKGLHAFMPSIFRPVQR